MARESLFKSWQKQDISLLYSAQTGSVASIVSNPMDFRVVFIPE
jgi:hypothetical protein